MAAKYPSLEPEYRKAKRRAWYVKNAARTIAVQRIYESLHQDKYKEYKSKYYLANCDDERFKQKMADANAKLRATPIGRIKHNISQQAYQKTERGRNVQRASRHRHRTVGIITADIFTAILAKYGRMCVYGVPNICTLIATTTDHFIPIRRGGTNDDNNLVPACHSCNSSKNGSEPFTWMMKKNVKFDIRRSV